MGLEVTKDEQDNRAEGMRAERREIIRRKKGKPAAISEEIIERDLEASMLRNPTDGYRYKYVNRRFNDGERVQRHEGDGYEIVTEENDTARPMIGVKKEGGFIRGDLILMRCTKANYERRRRKADEKLARASRDQSDSSREKINQLARDGRLIGPHKDASFETSAEGKPFLGPSANDL